MWMCDRLLAGKPSRHLAGHLVQLSLSSLRGRLMEYQLAWLGLRQGTHLHRVAGNIATLMEGDIPCLCCGISPRKGILSFKPFLHATHT